MARHVAQLERRLSDAIDPEGLARFRPRRPADVDALQRRITQLEQEVAYVKAQLADRTEELAAARAANRELMVQLNAIQPRRG